MQSRSKNENKQANKTSVSDDNTAESAATEPSKTHGLWVALWLVIPLAGCLLYGFLTR